jgi:hypothetical protein
MNGNPESGENANYAMTLRQTNPAKMAEMESQVRQFLEHGKKTGILVDGDNLNDAEMAMVANYVANRLHRKLKQSENISEEEMNQTIEDALLTGVAERLHMKENGLRDPEL